MIDVKVRESVWQNFLEIARKQRKSPDSLVHRVLLDYIERTADEELLRRSQAAAQKAPFKISETEKIIRRQRRNRRSTRVGD